MLDSAGEVINQEIKAQRQEGLPCIRCFTPQFRMLDITTQFVTLKTRWSGNRSYAMLERRSSPSQNDLSVQVVNQEIKAQRRTSLPGIRCFAPQFCMHDVKTQFVLHGARWPGNEGDTCCWNKTVPRARGLIQLGYKPRSQDVETPLFFPYQTFEVILYKTAANHTYRCTQHKSYPEDALCCPEEGQTLPRPRTVVPTLQHS